MPNHQSPRRAAYALSPGSSSVAFDTLYAGRERAGRPARVSAQMRQKRSIAPDAIWGQFNNYRSNGLTGSAIVHVAALALLLSGATFGHQVVQQVKEQHETVTLIAPSPDSYTMPVAKKIVSGGGGGGDRDKLPATKGRLPKPAMQQITPPAIIVRN